MVLGILALTVAAIFAGAAIYVLVAEQPARLQLDDRALLTEWKPSYKRGAAMQASIALVSCVFGLIAWWQTAQLGFLIGAVAILLPWPWTLFVIKSTNDALLATAAGDAGPQTRALIEKWGSLHSIRAALGMFATAAFFWTCVSR